MNNSTVVSITLSVVCYHTPLDMIERMLASAIDAMQKLRVSSSFSFSSSGLRILLIDNSENNQLNMSEFGLYADRLQSIDCELRLIQGQGNVGYGAGQNLGITGSKDEYYLLMNPDVELHEDCLLEGVNFLRNNPGVAIASPSALDEKGNRQYLCKRFPSLWILFVRGFMPRAIQKIFRRQMDRYEMRDLNLDSSHNDIPIVSGCFMLCRTNALQKIGGFNDDYFLYFEDFDLSMRMSEVYALAYVPMMKIIHHGGYASRKGIKHIKMFTSSAIRFFITYGWKIF